MQQPSAEVCGKLIFQRYRRTLSPNCAHTIAPLLRGDAAIMASLAIKELSSSTVGDFRQLLSVPPEGWCWCVAWEVPTWEGWGQRQAEDNRRLREELWSKGDFYGYVFYEQEKPIGWCRVGPTQVWPKLCSQFGLAPSVDEYVFTCFGLRPEFRGVGNLHELVPKVINDLRRRGIKTFFALPKRIEGRARPGEVWNGPFNVFQRTGFEVIRSTERNYVMQLRPSENVANCWE